MRVLLAFCVALLTGCAQLVPAPQVEPVDSRAALAAYERVLSRFVDARGAVDFAALSRDRRDLDLYIRHVADTPLGAFAQRDEKLAHLINSYNALAMYNVVASGIPPTHAGLAKVEFFVLRKLAVGGEPISLYDYENRIIRPLGEPRVHFALNCMAVSCPRLPRAPFSAGRLGEDLERETRLFLAEPRNLRVDAAKRTVHLSEIFAFYPEDFLREAPSLLAWVNRYLAEPIPENYRVQLIPYDWTVNRQ